MIKKFHKNSLRQPIMLDEIPQLPIECLRIIVSFIIFDVAYSRERYILYKPFNINMKPRPLRNLDGKYYNLSLLLNQLKRVMVILSTLVSTSQKKNYLVEI